MLKFIRNTTWEEVFKNWRKREASNSDWIQCATKIKRWPNWELWRKHSASQLKAEERKWKLYEFTDPINEIPAMLIGPYSSWQNRLLKKNVASFEELLSIPEQLAEFSEHARISSILKNLPFQAELIGLVRKDNNKIVCLEGHHTSTAFSLAKKQGKKLDFSDTKINIALAHLPKNDIYLLDEALKRGSSRQ